MTSLAGNDHDALVAALRTALDGRAADAQRPGQLRSHLESALGPAQAQRLRPLVHQVVAAAQDNLPADLARIAPLTPQALQRLSGELASARGWSTTTAQRATLVWVAALGFDELAASSWPARPRPEAAGRVELAATVLPPSAADHPRPESDAGEPVTTDPSWPSPPKRLAGITHSQAGESATSVTLGFAGMSLQLVTVLVVALIVVLCAPIVVLGGSGGALPLVGILLAGLLVRRLGYGALVATSTGLEFTPYDGALRRARPEQAFAAPWSTVTVEEGLVSRVVVDGRRIQLPPAGRRFARACAATRQAAS